MQFTQFLTVCLWGLMMFGGMATTAVVGQGKNYGGVVASQESSELGPWGVMLGLLVKANAHSSDLSSGSGLGSIESSASGDGEKYDWLPMNVTTKVAVGGPDVTIYGNTKSINAQILKMNPNYKVEDFMYQDAFAPEGEPSTAVVPPKCNNWSSSGSINLLEEGIVDMNNSWYPVVVPMKSCVELSCVDGAAIGLCNDNKEPLTKIIKTLIPYLELLIDYCLSSTGTVNGQIFDTRSFNLVFNEGNCTMPARGENYHG